MSRIIPFLAGVADEREFNLRFAISNKLGSAEIRYFKSPADMEGLLIRLTARERDLLASSLAQQGLTAIERDDAPDLQLRLPLETGVAA